VGCRGYLSDDLKLVGKKKTHDSTLGPPGRGVLRHLEVPKDLGRRVLRNAICSRILDLAMLLVAMV
jgi:hypothetical protein